MVAAAMIGSAAIGGIASGVSGNKAAGAAEDASKESSATQRYMYDTSRRDFAPYRDVGTSALNRLAALYGLETSQGGALRGTERPVYDPPKAEGGGDLFAPGFWDMLSFGAPGTSRQDFQDAIVDSDRGNYDELYNQRLAEWEDANRPALEGEVIPANSGPSYDEFYNSPDYKFAYDQGMRSVEQSLAKRGLTGSGSELSGAAMKALTRFGQGLASQQLGNYKNTLAAMAGIGQTSTSQLAGLGQNTAQGIASDIRSAGDARASSYLNTGSAISNAADSYGQYRLLQAGGYLK